ncbi:excalibur calcium-binding domain-containing protein [Micromonospora aurantiaca]
MQSVDRHHRHQPAPRRPDPHGRSMDRDGDGIACESRP